VLAQRLVIDDVRPPTMGPGGLGLVVSCHHVRGVAIRSFASVNITGAVGLCPMMLGPEGLFSSAMIIHVVVGGLKAPGRARGR